MAGKKSWVEVILIPLVVAIVGISGTYFITNQQQESAETKAAADRQVKILEIFAEKISSTDESERIFALRLLGAVDDDLAAKLAKAVSETEQKATKVKIIAEEVVEDAAARSGSLPRIYLHIRDEKNREAARKIGNLLSEKGYIIPGIERLVDIGPALNQLRYFRKSEKSEANKIVEFLNLSGVDVNLQYINGYENSSVIQPQHYELWFAQGQPPTL